MAAVTAGVVATAAAAAAGLAAGAAKRSARFLRFSSSAGSTMPNRIALRVCTSGNTRHGKSREARHLPLAELFVVDRYSSSRLGSGGGGCGGGGGLALLVELHIAISASTYKRTRVTAHLVAGL